MVKTLRKAAPLNQNGGMDHPSVWLTLSPAIFGLVGVIIGGLITSGTSYWLETRKDKREQEKESRIRAATLRQAARLVDEEFWLALGEIQLLVAKKRWAADSGLESMRVIWDEHKTILATELSTSVWRKVFMAHVMVKQLVTLRAASSKLNTGDVPNNVLEMVKRFPETIENGRTALQPFITSEPSVEHA